jgi:hypothetical protein
LKVPAEVAQARCFTLVSTAVSACCAKPNLFAWVPGWMPGPFFASPAATPMSMLLNSASASSSATSR